MTFKQRPTIRRSDRAPAGAGFTLVEILVAITIMAMATAIASSTFFVISRSYQHGTSLTQNLHYGDFLMEQLVLGLRSAYHPETHPGARSDYGFWLDSGGLGASGGNRISWVKTGHALIGRRTEVSHVPHRVQFNLETDSDGRQVAVVRAWRTALEPEDFDPQRVEPIVVSRRIRDFECRVALEVVDEQLDWLNQWEHTNRVPPAIELTLYLEPIEEGDDPIRMRRVVGMPIAPLSWQQ